MRGTQDSGGVERIVSGAQTGVDRAALDVALDLGIPCGGWVPRGRIDELGRIPDRYPDLRETATADFSERTAANVRDSDGTLIISRGALTGGSLFTREVAQRLARPCLHVDLSVTAPSEAERTTRAWLRAESIATLNVAGPRASKDPGGYQAAFGLLRKILGLRRGLTEPILPPTLRPGRTMTTRVNLYDSHYARLEADVYAAIRADVYGDDLGQTGWITISDARRFYAELELAGDKRALDVACGSGGLTRAMHTETGADAVGVDINPFAIEAATRHASEAGLTERVSYQVVDAGEDLPFDGLSFDAVLCNDAINHIPNRQHLFDDWHRVLRPGGRVLFTDPIVVTGQLTKEEIEIRSSIGYFLFTPPGINEELLENAGFEVLDTEDMTSAACEIAGRWRDARAKRREAVVALEGEHEFEGLQGFFDIVTVLAGEGRLSRFRFLARKRGE